MAADVDVLVVGLGPVGAALCNLLGIHGVRVCVIDQAADIHMAPRAIALDNEALRVLQMCGLEDGDFDKVPIPEVRMHSPVLGQFSRAITAGAIDAHPKLVTFYQPQLERALIAGHDVVLLGERGQGKTRLLRSLIDAGAAKPATASASDGEQPTETPAGNGTAESRSAGSGTAGPSAKNKPEQGPETAAQAEQERQAERSHDLQLR